MSDWFRCVCCGEESEWINHRGCIIKLVDENEQLKQQLAAAKAETEAVWTGARECTELQQRQVRSAMKQRDEARAELNSLRRMMDAQLGRSHRV